MLNGENAVALCLSDSDELKFLFYTVYKFSKMNTARRENSILLINTDYCLPY